MSHFGTAHTGVAISGDGDTYTVTVEGLGGDGSFTLAVDTNGDVTDLAGNALAASATSDAVLLDSTPPEIGIGAPSATVTAGGPVTYAVSYAGADSVTLAPVDVTLHATGTAAATLAVGGDGSEARTVTLSGITGDGTLGISIGPGTASDLAGNLAPEAGPSEPTAVDNTAPSVALGQPSSALTNTGPVTYSVSYAGADEVTLATEEVVLHATGTATGTIGVSGSGTTLRTVSISDIGGDGTLAIGIAAGTAMDAAGNVAPAAGPSEAFDVDNTAPEVGIGAPSRAWSRGKPVAYAVEFAGADSVLLDAEGVVLHATGTATGTVAVSGSGTVSRTVTLENIAGDGTLGIGIAAGAASDAAGNLAPETGPSATFTVDSSTDVHVATDGSDVEGDGTPDSPWRTIAFALAEMGPLTESLGPITIHLGPGIYEERVFFAPHMRLVGAGPESVLQHFDLQAPPHTVVTMAEDTVLADLTVTLPETGLQAITALVRIEDVTAVVENVVLDSRNTLNSIGVNVSGPGSSGGAIRDCVFRRIHYGIQAVDTAINITRNTFEDIRGDAVFIESPSRKEGPIGGDTPVLGLAEDTEATGFNVFRNVSGMLVHSFNPNPTLAQMNDWGLYTSAAIADKMVGNIVFEPFLGGEGEGEGEAEGGKMPPSCFAGTDGAVSGWGDLSVLGMLLLLLLEAARSRAKHV